MFAHPDTTLRRDVK